MQVTRFNTGNKTNSDDRKLLIYSMNLVLFRKMSQFFSYYYRQTEWKCKHTDCTISYVNSNHFCIFII